MQLSLIIPAYEEAHRIGQTLTRIEDFIHSRVLQCEVIVVVDGGRDDTLPVVEEFIGRGDFCGKYRVVSQPRNMGKGAAVRRGVEESSGEFIGFTDADLPFGMEAVHRAWELLEQDAEVDIVVGERNVHTADPSLSPPVMRRVAGRVYSWLARGIVNTGIADTQCGLKVFRGDVARAIFSRTTVDGFGFDVEVIHIARVNGFRIERIAVDLHQHEGSRVKLLRDSTRMLMELIRIRAKDLRRFYHLELERDQIPGSYQYKALHDGPAVQRAWHRNRLEIMELVLEELESGEQEIGLALDAGCGSGIAWERLEGRARTLIGIDLHAAPLRFASRKCPTSRGRLARASATHLPFASGSFDLVLFQEVIEHLSASEIQATLAEFHRVLQPGGVLWITTPNYRGLWPLIEYALDALHLTPRMGGDQHLSKFTRQSLAEALRASGFSVEQLGGFNFLSPWLAALSMRMSARLAKLEARHPKNPGLLIYAVARKAPLATTNFQRQA